MRTQCVSLCSWWCLAIHLSLAASVSDWNALNASVGGRLFSATPLSLPCFSYYEGQSRAPQPAQCREVQQAYLKPTYRAEHFGAYMYVSMQFYEIEYSGVCIYRPVRQPEWETCQATGARCLLDSTMPNNTAAYAPPQNCRQGSVPDYYVSCFFVVGRIKLLHPIP
jgi:hypothetical protein